MPQTFQRTRRVEFADNDQAGFVHFTNYLKYMEETEYAFLRSVGLNVVMRDEKGMLGFPRLAASCRYLKPARHDDDLEISLAVKANDGKSLTYAFRISRSGEEIAHGELQSACCRFPMEGDPYAIPLPENVLQRIPLT